MNKKWNNPGSNRGYYKPLYDSWKNMKKRCGNSTGKNPTYSDVTVCKEWYDYDVFFEWAINNGWKPGLTIDKDSIKPGNRVYCPEYCKWMTRSENAKEVHIRMEHPMKNPNIAAKISGRNHYLYGKYGKDNPKSKKVKCLENGIIYDSCGIAEASLNLRKGSVRMVANPNSHHKQSGGYHFEYIGG